MFAWLVEDASTTAGSGSRVASSRGASGTAHAPLVPLLQSAKERNASKQHADGKGSGTEQEHVAAAAPSREEVVARRKGHKGAVGYSVGKSRFHKRKSKRP